MMQEFWWRHMSKTSKIHWMSWEKMGHSKSTGGLDFKDFVSFNQALLAKQGWRLIQQPNSLRAMIIKAKYHPDSSFWKYRWVLEPLLFGEAFAMLGN